MDSRIPGFHGEYLWELDIRVATRLLRLRGLTHYPEADSPALGVLYYQMGDDSDN